MRARVLPIVLVLGLFASDFMIGGQAATLTLIASGSAWRYNDTGADLGSAWKESTYNDAGWSVGPAQLGYGDADEATIISYGPDPNNKYITTYFRHAFNVTNPSSLASLSLQVKRDDGCVIYLNGVEVARSNMPSGSVSWATLASTAVNEDNENAWFEFPVDPSRLVPGTNVVAVEVHQNGGTSTDVTFDLLLRATTSAAPPTIAVQLTSPSNQAIVNSTAVTFTASVSATTGLASAALEVSGATQTVTFSGTTQVQDAQLTADSPTQVIGGAVSLKVDGASPHAHSVMKFPTLVGTGPGRVPAGSAVQSAVLTVNCTNLGNVLRIFRLSEDWVEDQASWNQRSTGVPWSSPGADGAGSHGSTELAGDCTSIGVRTIDLTTFVQQWVDGQPNYGVVFVDSGTDGVDFDSSERGATGPLLTVVYRERAVPIQMVPLSGTTATVSIPASLANGATYFWNIEVTDTAGLKQQAPAAFQVTVDIDAADDPVVVLPLDGATNVSPTTQLQARVSTPAGGPITTTVSIREATDPEFTVIALPDTQHYSESFPSVFTSQTQWIVANKTARNIVFVTHEGDIVEHNSNTTEWDRANASMSLLDGVVPYGLGPGNHDLPTTLFNQYFPFTRYAGLPWYGGHYQNLNDNNFQFFSGGGRDFVIVHLVFCPSTAVLGWAKSVFDSYPNRVGIMTTHGYLDTAGQRNVHVCGSTQGIWDNLGAITPNLQFMLSGHVSGEGRRTDVVNGRVVHQMLADYQDRPSGGDGWLRILRFVPADNKVYVQTYSPWLNQFEVDADSEFPLDFTMSDPFTTSAPVVVPSGTNATFQPTLQPNTSYEWRVTVTNAAGKTKTGPLWKFTTGTGGSPNQPPYATSATVHLDEDTSMGIDVQAGDPEGQPITYTLLSGPSNGTLTGTLPSVTYQPAPHFTGTDTFTFSVSDGQLTSGVATITLVVDPINDPPAASGDSYGVSAGSSLVVPAPGVLANDTDVDGTPLTAELVTGVANGTLSLNANGSFTYTPAAGYSGADSFTYRASDGTATSAPVVVSIAVNAVNQPPVANASTVAAVEDTAVGITVSGSDPDGQSITYQLVSGPSHGTLTGSLPSVTYQPAANYFGPDAFTFRVSDGQLTSANATVTINVAAVNDAPVASGESYSVTTGSSLVIAAPGVLGNDTDVDGGPLTAQLVMPVTNGSLTLNANGSFTYTPAPGFTGLDSFAYAARDASAASLAVAVNIVVMGLPPGPLFTARFTSGAEGFTYVDNTFRGTTQSAYASGTWVSSGGFSGGALRTYVGGVNNNTINNMSGGWRRSFTLSAAASLSLTFRYRMDQGPDYETDEYSQVLASLNGVLYGASAGVDYVRQVVGNGNGGASIDTGWVQVTINLGVVQAGTHTLTLGGFNNRKTSESERTRIWFDEVSVIVK